MKTTMIIKQTRNQIKTSEIMIRINCFVKVTDKSNVKDVIEHANALVAATLEHDKGCVAYDFFASTTRDDVFMFCETWENDEMLDIHSKAEHFKTHVGAIEQMAEISIEKMER